VLIGNTRPVLEVREHGIANFLRQRESRFATTLAFNNNAALTPINMGKTKRRHISGT
jgi:hypothetical protein